MAVEYDVIIVGSGAGGGTLAHSLAPSGRRVLILERGDWLPREVENWDADAVFVQNRYVSKDTWYDARGTAFQPQIHYFVGGATKFYGAALYRLREQDFGEVKHHGGISPAWPIGYDVMEPYYTRAERLYQVHGLRGEDPTEPPASSPYPFPPVSHEPRIQALFDGNVAGLWMWEQSPASLLARYGSIRGASSFGVSYPKMYIDGIEVANPLLLTDLNPASLDRVEIIRGPASARVGPSARRRSA